MSTAVIGVCLRPASQAVMGNMKEEIDEAPLPIVHYGLDLWTCTRTGRKFIDVHTFLVDSNFTLRHALLAVSHESLLWGLFPLWLLLANWTSCACCSGAEWRCPRA